MESPSPRIRESPVSEWVALSSGIRARIMVEGNGSSIILYRLDAGSRFERHSHPFPELGVVLMGRGFALIGDEKRAVREGDAYFFPGGSLHGFEVDEGEPVVLLNVTVPLTPELEGPPSAEVLQIAKELVRAH